MAVNYNTLRTMKGMAIGTIIPWSGQISGSNGIPKGWLACTSGKICYIEEYPELYEIIGNRYGGSEQDGYFVLPSISGKSLGDYHPSHATELGYTGNFASYLGTDSDIANQNIVTQSSNIDLYVTLSPVNDLKASMTGHNINASSYGDTFGYVDRRLGDLHWGSHSHSGSFPSVKTTNRRIEDCQNNWTANGFGGCVGFLGLDCSDICQEIEYYRCSNVSGTPDDLCIPKYDGGEHVGWGGVPYGTNGYQMRRTSDPRNYINQSDDCFLYNDNGVSDNGSFSGIYGTTLSTNVVNFNDSSLSGHNHAESLYTINTGNVYTKQTVNVNTIATGNLTPVNLDNREVMSIEFNVSTPSIQMLYIIKAY